MAELWRRLGREPPAILSAGLTWGALQPGPEVVAGPPLFPREVSCAARRSDQQPQLARRRDQAALHRESLTRTGAGPGGPTH